MAPTREYKPQNVRLKSDSTVKRIEPGVANQPLSQIEWVDPEELRASSFNPNRVYGPELRLIKISLLEAGWCAPIVVVLVNSELYIVDGFHRWCTAKGDPEILRLGEGKVPVVRQDRNVEVDLATHIFSTVRMNRARGSHEVVRMADLVAQLLELGISEEEVAERAQMQEEEVFRLSQRGKMTERGAAEDLEFGDSWAPDHEADKASIARVESVRAEREAEKKGKAGKTNAVGTNGDGAQRRKRSA